MKTKLRLLPFLLGALAFVFGLGLLGCAPTAHAQEAVATLPNLDAAGNAIVSVASAAATPFIVSFAQEHPWLVTLLAAIATLRLVFKPIISVAEAYVRSTPSTADDAWLNRAQHSKAFKIAAWLLDYLGSIKVGPQFTAKPGEAAK
jgi:predicted neutral ceramidase superfamily lipid hydrolase